MGQSVIRRLKHVMTYPEPIDGEVVDIDTGYEATIVVTVETDGETYYEEYELTNITESEPAE